MEQLDDILKEFLVESYENLDELDRSLVQLENNPDDRARLAAIFRTVHTIKGTCGFLGFGKLEKVTHVGESLLSKLRDGEIRLRPDITTGLLSLVDAIRQVLNEIESSGTEGQNEFGQLIEHLIELQSMSDSLAAAGKPKATPTKSAPATPPQAQISPPPVALTPLAAQSPIIEPTVETDHSATDNAASENDDQNDSASSLTTQSSQASGADSSATGGPSTQSGEAKSSAVSEGSIRVDVALLDRLMNQVGELVLARNQVLQFAANNVDAAFLSTTQRLNLITSELQEGVMKTRMQPIGTIWSKFPRVVRDLASICGKQVRIEMKGKETELDKTIIEAIKDPLTHLVRNSVDHGIESPETRAKNGKPEEGCLILKAYHEGGQVNIEIVDDGAGLNFDRIKSKAIEKGLITKEHASKLPDREVGQLIFLPGFSTAEKVSNVSGRGVGMDVVKTNIEKIGGTVDLQSKPGAGTTIRIKIPLTLAIIPALIVTCEQDRYAIPQVNLQELVRLEGDQAKNKIERIQGAPVYRLRGRLLPLVDLRHELHGIDGGFERNTTNIVVLRADDRQFGLVVDHINDSEEIVVKPLSKQLKNVSCYAGATIMGDGRVALILDVMGLAHSAHVIAGSKNRMIGESNDKSNSTPRNQQTLLVLGVGPERRFALPIDQVTRLEKIELAEIEHADHQEVVQYRGEILPLIRLSETLGVPSNAGMTEPLEVVVYSEGKRSVGIVVDRIIDIVATELTNMRRAQREGLLNSVVIDGHVTDLIDLPAVIRMIDPSYFEVQKAGA